MQTDVQVGLDARLRQLSAHFHHWEKIKDVASIALHTQAAVSVPTDAGLKVDYCVGADGCSWSSRKSTGSFGPCGSGYTNVTLH